MALVVSPCVGLVTPDPGAAAGFLCDVLDMEIVGTDAGIELWGGPLRFFIDPGQPRPLVFELATDDHAQARQLVRSFGFEELVWRGPGQSCLARDPFGLVFNIHQDSSGLGSFDLEGFEPALIKPCIGAGLPDPHEAASFYSEVLDSPFSRLPDGSYVVGSGPVRLRFRFGVGTAPMVWLRADAPVKKLLTNGCRKSDGNAVVDPYGVHWCVEAAPEARTAVVCPL
ncbi:MAG: VOC family protein [Armatimonadetes bacterium]|nr:VOC family protein [Armatimonadota bacterium]